MFIVLTNFTVALVQPVLSLKNGLELILTFLILLQLLYLIFKVRKTLIAWGHIAFLLTLFVHFVLLNIRHYFGILIFEPFLFYPCYGFFLLMTADLLAPSRSKVKAFHSYLHNILILLCGMAIFFFVPLEYHLGSLHLAIVLILVFHRVRQSEHRMLKQWLLRICGFMIFLVGIFPVTSLLTTTENYLIFKIPYAIVFVIFLTQNLYSFLNKPRFFVLSENDHHEASNHLLLKLTEALEGQKMYKKPALTLHKFANEIGEPVYKISRTLNQHYGKSFPELVNHLRISDIKEQLIKQERRKTKIESLAYEAGFGTPSSFYVAFKKELGVTPKEFKENSTGSDST